MFEVEKKFVFQGQILEIIEKINDKYLVRLYLGQNYFDKYYSQQELETCFKEGIFAWLK
jgi:hypothetical protein